LGSPDKYKTQGNKEKDVPFTTPPPGDSFAKEGLHHANLKVTPQVPAGLTVQVSSGFFWNDNQTLVEFSAGSSAALNLPSTNNNLTVIALDLLGNIVRIEGSEAATPDLPAIPADRIPLAAVLLSPSDTQINADMIFDLRPVYQIGANLEDTLTVAQVVGLTSQLDLKSDAVDFARFDASGTDVAVWELNKNHTGIPGENVSLRVNRGSETKVELRWNESVEQWQFTNDGTVFLPLDSTSASGITVDLSSVNASISANASAIVVLEASALAHHQSISVLNVSVLALQASVDGLQASVTANASSITVLQASVSEWFLGDLEIVAQNSRFEFIANNSNPDVYFFTSGGKFQFQPNVTNNASAVVMQIGNFSSLTDASAKIIRFVNGSNTEALEVAYVGASGNFAASRGCALRPAFTFRDDTGIGMYRGGTDRLSFAAGSELVLEFNACVWTVRGDLIPFSGSDNRDIGTLGLPWDAIIASALTVTEVFGPLYDIAGTTFTQPTASAVIMRFVTPRTYTIPSGFTNSRALSGIAASGATVYNIKRFNSSAVSTSVIGTITWAAASTNGIYADSGELDNHPFVVGDVLSITAPGTADDTHDELSWTIVGTLT
jgi:hypothetical protein